MSTIHSPTSPHKIPSTADESYTNRLVTLQSAWWKRLLDVQAPYRWKIRSLKLGKTLEIGCGVGRVLANLETGSVGTDHNPHSVAVCRNLGLLAYTSEEFLTSEHAKPESFDSIVVAHVFEHLPPAESRQLVKDHLQFLKPGGRFVSITPQEAGYASDKTHVTFMNFARIRELLSTHGLESIRYKSFPFPRIAGRLFKYNEFLVVARKPF